MFTAAVSSSSSTSMPGSLVLSVVINDNIVMRNINLSTAVILLYMPNTVNSRYLESVGTIFYMFKLPEVQINLHFG